MCSMKMEIAIGNHLMCTSTFVMMTNTEESVSQTACNTYYSKVFLQIVSFTVRCIKFADLMDSWISWSLLVGG